jgi:hypothetical protein
VKGAAPLNSREDQGELHTPVVSYGVHETVNADARLALPNHMPATG